MTGWDWVNPRIGMLVNPRITKSEKIKIEKYGSGLRNWIGNKIFQSRIGFQLAGIEFNPDWNLHGKIPISIGHT